VKIEEELKKLKIKTWDGISIKNTEHLLKEYQRLLLFAQKIEKIVNRLSNIIKGYKRN
jgi:hypothetical protein